MIFGPPGAGKGTQAASLVDRFAIVHVSSGDMLRANLAAGSPLGLEAKRYMDAGELVPDEVVIGMVVDRLQADDAARGVLLDGFPRTLPQAEGLDAALAGVGQRIDAIVVLDVAEEEIVGRLSDRGRADDDPDVIRNRFRVYREQTEPVLGYYRGAGVPVHVVDGVGPVDEVQGRIVAALGAA